MTSVKPNSYPSSECLEKGKVFVKLSEQSDESLMLSYSNGQSNAFEELYKRHKAPLYRYCKRQFKNLSAAEECFQETWMKLVRSRKRYQSTAKFTTYLYRIAQNNIIDTYRKEKKRLSDCEYDDSLDENESISQLGTNDFYKPKSEVNKHNAVELRKAIGELPFDQKNALLLKMDNGLSIEQIAEITECKKESVKSRLRYAATKLKQLLNSNAFKSVN